MSDHHFQAPSPEYLAELLPQYDVELFIAQGGMGAVYKGRQISLDRDIAIKVLPHEVGESEEFRESFISEAKSMARLNHSNLLGVFDYGTVEGMPYIVMEYVEGGSLHEAAWNQAIEASQAVLIVKGICDGLAHAHEHGIVHRDIKPSNILLTPKLEPKVADFGLAHAADSDKPGLVMGTPGYTAPEVFQDPNLAGPLADIYSVGVILHQLLTGIDPAGSMEPPVQPTGNIRLDTIWRKATNMNPSQRYPSIAAMAGDLEKWIAAKQKSAVAPKPSPLAAPRRPVAVQAESGGGFMGKLVIIGVLIALVVFAYLMLQERKPDAVNDTADATGTETPVTAAPMPVPEVSPDPVSLPTEDDTPSFEPDPEPIEIGVNEDPMPVAEVDDEPEEPEPSENQEPGDPELRERAIGLIGEARKKRDKEFSDNASTLDINLKGFSRNAEPDELTLLESLKEDIIDNRIPQIEGVIGLPGEMARAFKDSLAKEESIDEKHGASLTRIRDAYVTRLEQAAEAASDENLKERLQAQAEEAGDLDDWIASLSPEPERVVIKSSGAAAGSFVGNWDVYAGNDQVVRRIAHRDGRMEIVGKDWEAFWKMMEDGTVEVKWTGKDRPDILTRDGEGWIGKTSFGIPLVFKRGDW